MEAVEAKVNKIEEKDNNLNAKMEEVKGLVSKLVELMASRGSKE